MGVLHSHPFGPSRTLQKWREFARCAPGRRGVRPRARQRRAAGDRRGQGQAPSEREHTPVLRVAFGAAAPRPRRERQSPPPPHRNPGPQSRNSEGPATPRRPAFVGERESRSPVAVRRSGGARQRDPGDPRGGAVQGHEVLAWTLIEGSFYRAPRALSSCGPGALALVGSSPAGALIPQSYKQIVLGGGCWDPKHSLCKGNREPEGEIRPRSGGLGSALALS